MGMSLRRWISEALSTKNFFYFERLRVDDELLKVQEVEDMTGVTAAASQSPKDLCGDLLHLLQVVKDVAVDVHPDTSARRQRLGVEFTHEAPLRT